MISSRELLSEFLLAVQRRTGARHAAGMLHLEPPEQQSALLVCPPSGDCVPEMASPDVAWTFVANHQCPDEDRVRVTSTPSADPQGCIIRVPIRQLLAQTRAQRRPWDERRREPEIRTAPELDGMVWIGLAGGDAAALLDELGGASADAANAPDQSVLGVGLRLAWSVFHLSRLMRDPVSRLPGRMELQVFLRRAIAGGRDSNQPIGLMLVNPDDFSMINHRYGRSSGDLAIRQIGEQLDACLRRTDGLFHYGGAVFAAVLPATDLEQCRITADKVRARLTSHQYLDNDASLTFSIGTAVAFPQDIATLDRVESELTARADAALDGARLSGGARALVVDMREDEEKLRAQLSPLKGVFAADTEKDYRNMLLLWDTVALVSTQTEPASIARSFVDRLAIGFRPDRIVLATVVDDQIQILASNIRDDSAPEGRAPGGTVQFDEAGAGLIRKAFESRQVARTGHNSKGAASQIAYAVPLMAHDACAGCLFLEFRGRDLQLDSSDVVFLTALATQMAVAIDRAELAERWMRDKDRESRSLKKEVRGLRQALQHTRMVYRSEEMHALMNTLRKVAPTPATVLIIGESGTGKEMLAQSLHELSDRRDAPFIVFDCGAVAHSLLESELFGHKKGAFTGAQSASSGCIAQADGGTLFLDEVGELPLEVQAKLLRFVQEKEFSPLGSSERRTVDVRIVAATNRELQDEVGAGRFRADLYYRLRVIALQAIPLRSRRDDILPLAHYFLEKYAAQQSSPAQQLSDAAEQKLLHYDWPGNVRELQHCVLRAVLTQDDDVLAEQAIELFPQSTPASNTGAVENSVARPPAPVDPQPDGGQKTADDPWQVLQDVLDHQVGLALENNSRRPVPLGRWLNEDLVLAASESCGDIVRQAAQALNVPESTFRRQLDKARAGAVTGMDFRQEGWAAAAHAIQQIAEHVASTQDDGENTLDQARDLLLQCVLARRVTRTSAGALLMGVSAPTYKRWLEARETVS